MITNKTAPPLAEGEKPVIQKNRTTETDGWDEKIKEEAKWHNKKCEIFFAPDYQMDSCNCGFKAFITKVRVEATKEEKQRHQTVLDKLAERMADSSHYLEYGCDCEKARAEAIQECAKVTREFEYSNITEMPDATTHDLLDAVAIDIEALK